MADTDLLPDLIPVDIGIDLQEILDQFPLPAGVQDADMNQEEIAQALNTTVNTVAKWIRDGMPVAEQGGNGRAYVLRLSHCFAWRRAREAEIDLRAKHNRAQVSAMQASFLGFDVDDPQVQMTAQQRRDAAQADIAWSKARQLRRQLVPLEDVVDMTEALLKHVREGIEAMPDRLERELNIRPDQVAAVVRIGADILQGMHDKIAEAELHEREVEDVEVQKQLFVV